MILHAANVSIQLCFSLFCFFREGQCLGVSRVNSVCFSLDACLLEARRITDPQKNRNNEEKESGSFADAMVPIALWQINTRDSKRPRVIWRNTKLWVQHFKFGCYNAKLLHIPPGVVCQYASWRTFKYRLRDNHQKYSLEPCPVWNPIYQKQS